MTTEDDAERRRVEAVAAVGVLGTPPEERFDRITRLAQELLDMPMSYLNMVDDVSLVVKSPQVPGEPAPRFPYGTAFCEYTVHGTGLFEVTDARRDPRFVDTPAVTQYGVRFYAGVPLRVPDGQAVGTLCVMHPEARSLSPVERDRLVALGRWAEGELQENLETAPPRASVPSEGHPALDADDLSARALAIPFGAVSGDLYAWAGGAGAVTVTLADVMGKGPVAGAVAAELREALYGTAGISDDGSSDHRNTRDGAAGPGVAVSRAATRLDTRLTELGAFVTLFHARIDTAAETDTTTGTDTAARTSTARLRYVDAGHGLTLHLKADGTVDRLHSRDLPLGLQNASGGWAETEVRMGSGDTLVAVTDGALDLYDSTLTSLERIAAEVRRQPTVADFLDGLATRVEVSAVDDDVTVLVVTVD